MGSIAESEKSVLLIFLEYETFKSFLISMPDNKEFSHLDHDNRICMVNVFNKDCSHRVALASARICISKKAYALLVQPKKNRKGEVLNTARIAGILAAKRCDELIPLCHSLPLDHVDIDFYLNENGNTYNVDIIAQCEANYKTGVEMEAMLACSVAALTIYDMCKSVDRGIIIEKVQLIQKAGGKGGKWTNN